MTPQPRVAMTQCARVGRCRQNASRVAAGAGRVFGPARPASISSARFTRAGNGRAGTVRHKPRNRGGDSGQARRGRKDGGRLEETELLAADEPLVARNRLTADGASMIPAERAASCPIIPPALVHASETHSPEDDPQPTQHTKSPANASLFGMGPARCEPATPACKVESAARSSHLPGKRLRLSSALGLGMAR